MAIQKFWVIHNPNGMSPASSSAAAKTKYHTEAEAIEEAKKMAYACPGGTKIYVLEAIACLGVLAQLQYIQLDPPTSGPSKTASEVVEALMERPHHD